MNEIETSTIACGGEMPAFVAVPGIVSKAPVVIVTSSNSTRDRNAAARGGADYYFCKPSKLEEFLKLGPILEQLWIASTTHFESASSDRPARNGKST